jgi:Skp family chaperone for outer membrane proteins
LSFDPAALKREQAEELRNQLLAEIAQVFRVIGQEGFDVILDVTMVHYYSAVVDITYEVIRKYNALIAQ